MGLSGSCTSSGKMPYDIGRLGDGEMTGRLIWLGISSIASPDRCLPSGERVFGGSTGGEYVDVVVELQCDLTWCGLLFCELLGARKGASTPRRGFTSFAHCGRKLSTLLLKGAEMEMAVSDGRMNPAGFHVGWGL